MAGGLGFEPRLAESESAVLPLDDPPAGASRRFFSTGRAHLGRAGVTEPTSKFVNQTFPCFAFPPAAPAGIIGMSIPLAAIGPIIKHPVVWLPAPGAMASNRRDGVRP